MSCFLTMYIVTGFGNGQVDAKEFAEELDLSPEEVSFPAKSSIGRKCICKQFSYEADDESV